MVTEYAKPIPTPTVDTQEFWDSVRRHHMAIQRCDQCGSFRWPPNRACPECMSFESTWALVSGRGKVYTFILMHQLYHQGFASELPYPVAIVELEEGPRLVTNIVGCPIDQLRCDMPVELVYEDIGEEATLYKFRPVPR